MSKRPKSYLGSTLPDDEIDVIERKHPRKAALLRACKAVGGARQLAERLPSAGDRRRRGVSHQIVYHWLAAGGVPESRVADVAAASGVPERELRGEAVAA